MQAEPPKINAGLDAAKDSEEEIIFRLAKLRPLDYDRVRREEASALGVQVKTLDDMVKASRDQERAANRLPFTEHEPADEAVDLNSMLSEIASTIRTHIVLDATEADAAALWVAHTYLVDVFEVSPIAIINAPERACAKTLFQSLLGRLAYRPLFASNASLSALFRSTEVWKPTLLIDEADTFFKDNAELHGLVNAGYKRGGFVLRSEASGDSFEPRMFSVYSPKSIAGIALERHLPDATMSRGIVFNMRRKLPDETVVRMRHADEGVFARLGSQLARFAQDYAQKVRCAAPHLPDSLSDRAQDNWEPLLAIASCAGQAWVDRALHAALKMSAASESQLTPANELLMDIQEIFSRRTRDKIRTTELIEELCDDDEKSWSSYNRGKPINPRQLAKQLEIYGIKPKTIRQPDGKTPKGYDRDQFLDAFERYLKALNPSSPGGVGAVATPVPRANVAATPQRTGADALNDFSADLQSQECGDVADISRGPPGISDEAAF